MIYDWKIYFTVINVGNILKNKYLFIFNNYFSVINHGNILKNKYFFIFNNYKHYKNHLKTRHLDHNLVVFWQCFWYRLSKEITLARDGTVRNLLWVLPRV